MPNVCGLAWKAGKCYIGAAVCTPAGEVAPRFEQGCAAPKEQPPRKLSGKRTAGGRALWKAAGGLNLPAAHRRSKPAPTLPSPLAVEGELVGPGESLMVHDRGGSDRTLRR